MDEELRRLQREYLLDVRQAIGRLRADAEQLRANENFKTAFPSLLFLTHQLKGSGGALGFPRISDVARQIGDGLSLFLDEKGTPRPTPSQLSDLVVTLSKELEREVEKCEA